MSRVSLQRRGRSAVYKERRLSCAKWALDQEVNGGRSHGHKPKGDGTACSVPAVGANVEITQRRLRGKQDTPSSKSYLMLRFALVDYEIPPPQVDALNGTFSEIRQHWPHAQPAKAACGPQHLSHLKNLKWWRLPSFVELSSLVDPNAVSSPTLSVGHPFGIIEAAFYWSATSLTGTSGATDAWGVFFNNGIVGLNGKPGTNYAWCMRGDMNAEVY